MLTELARHLGRTDDPVVRQKLADVHIVDFLIRKVAQRGDDLRHRNGVERGAEGSILKLLGSQQNFRIADLAGEMLGPAFAADTGDWGTYTWSRFLTGAPGDAHRRRHRRDPAQHPRREGAGPAAMSHYGDRCGDIAEQLEAISAELDEVSFELLQQAVADGATARPGADKTLTQARRAVEKAAALLRQLD